MTRLHPIGLATLAIALLATLIPSATATPIQQGTASWYGTQYSGRPTASGEPFNPNALTAAHPQLPFGSEVKVTHQQTGQAIEVRINDRMPPHSDRIIDLSRAAAEAIGILRAGLGPVQLELLD
ncbi:septal ring lytic transglycosylase RlpA family protein [Synechococcus sp. PCC 7336]|uniref:septal ring lytic transglycosylase RlpA family protein n=1 Tax=Synechococcus sp. PCC 7336 TaxID=195250 RepID=UPI00035F96C4|nr:septal ring lytic transglycosylase RlpA family protein [Synechococcus sp. PCC 7336]